MSEQSEWEWRLNRHARDAYTAAECCSQWAIWHRDYLTEGMHLDDVERARAELRRALRLMEEVVENAQKRAA